MLAFIPDGDVALSALASSDPWRYATAAFFYPNGWYELAILLSGATLGGYAGGALGQRLPPALLRALVILVGSGMTLYYFRATYFAG